MIETVKHSIERGVNTVACKYYTKRKHYYGEKYAYSSSEERKEQHLEKYNYFKNKAAAYV